ncbi:hypothetical protein QTP88_006944 [Uroleucon formosanum]
MSYGNSGFKTLDDIDWNEFDNLQRELEAGEDSSDKEIIRIDTTNESQFIPDEIMKNCAFYTNTRYVLERGKSLNTSKKEMKKFFRISIFISSMSYPQFRMYWARSTKGKPKPEGLKNFVLADKNGLVLDFFIYQGKKTSINHEDCEYSLTLAESVKKKYSTGTLIKNHLPKNIKLITDKKMMKLKRGSSRQYVKEDNKIVLVKWFDNKPIHFIFILSSESGKRPIDTCRHWSKKELKKIDAERPNLAKSLIIDAKDGEEDIDSDNYDDDGSSTINRSGSYNN